MPAGVGDWDKVTKMGVGGYEGMDIAIHRRCWQGERRLQLVFFADLRTKWDIGFGWEGEWYRSSHSL